MFDFCKKKKKENSSFARSTLAHRAPKAMSLYRSTLTRTVKSRDFREDALIIIGTLKQQRQPRLRKCLLKSEVALIALLPSCSIRQMLAIFFWI